MWSIVLDDKEATSQKCIFCILSNSTICQLMQLQQKFYKEQQHFIE